MFGASHWELLIVALVIFILFGHRLPKVLGSVGQGLRSFQDGLSGRELPASNASAKELK